MNNAGLNKRDQRAMNRIRKRRAALMLLGGMNKNGTNDDDTAKNNKDGDEVDEIKKTKLFCVESADAEDNQLQKASPEQKAFETTSTTTTVTFPSCSSTVANSSSAAIVDAADHLLEQARALSHELRTKVDEKQCQPHPRQPQQGPRFRFQLDKLQGRNLGERELAGFLHKMTLGSHNALAASRSAAKWIRFESKWKPLQFLVVRVNCEDRKMLDTNQDAKFIDDYFERQWIRMAQNVRDRDKFWQAIGTVVQSRHELLIRKIKTHADPLLAIRRPERKAQLLMSLEQMVESKYPFPTENTAKEEKNKKERNVKWKDIRANQGQIPNKSNANNTMDEPKIRPTRQIYRRIGENSPILALDCEMCFTSADRLELTRISVVNEKGNVLMDQLVKPHNKITNYIAHKSGITEQKLKNVTTRLKDVQEQFCSLLTDDTILCGHSLENDLEALQFSHPFCIDTSVLFNFAGKANIRTGLKALAKIFLDIDIQRDTKNGHCSIEDALTTLKLVQLKLDKGLQFGNVALGWNFHAWAHENGLTVTGKRICNANVVEMVKRGTKEETKVEMIKLNESIASSTMDSFVASDDPNSPFLINSGIEKKDLKKEKDEENTSIEEEGIVQKVDVENGKRENEIVETMTKPMTNQQIDNENGDEDAEIVAGKIFDFAEAVRIDNAMQKTAQFSDCFQWANESMKRKRTMLVAMTEPNSFFKANECSTLINLSNQAEWERKRSTSYGSNSSPEEWPNNKLHRICAHLAPKLIDHDLIMLELNCPKGTSKLDLDEAFHVLTEGICNNSMVFLVMAATRGGKGGTNAIMYTKIHQKQQRKERNEEEQKEDCD